LAADGRTTATVRGASATILADTLLSKIAQQRGLSRADQSVINSVGADEVEDRIRDP
jgi:hypothetical protein